MIPLLGGSLLFAVVLLWAAPPTPRCDLFRHGKFEERVDERQAAITGKKNGSRTFRQGVSQWDHDRDTGLKVRYRVLWRKDCTFLLFDRKVRSGVPDRVWAESDTITVHITDTWQEGFRYEQSSNFSDRTSSGTVRRIVPQGFGISVGL